MSRLHVLERTQRAELHRSLVRRDLKQIFDYRHDAVAREMGVG